MALISLLSNHMKEIGDAAKLTRNSLAPPKDCRVLGTLITKLIEKVYTGELLSVKPQPSSSTGSSAKDTPMVPFVPKASFITPSNEIIPEEDEDSEVSSQFVPRQSFTDDSDI